MQDLVENWQEFLQYLQDNRDWYKYVERGITYQVAQDFRTFMYWFTHDKTPKKEEKKA